MHTADKATARPWRVGDAGATVFGPPVANGVPEIVAQRLHIRNARLIVAAVNERDALRARLAASEERKARLRVALEDIADRLEAACENGATAQVAGECADMARAALARKEGAA
jgi:hypothetical protein